MLPNFRLFAMNSHYLRQQRDQFLIRVGVFAAVKVSFSWNMRSMEYPTKASQITFSLPTVNVNGLKVNKAMDRRLTTSERLIDVDLSGANRAMSFLFL